MEHLALCPRQDVEGVRYKFLGILSKNREEWAISDIACLRSSVTIVPFYDSLGADAIAFIMNQTELEALCCEGKYIDLILGLKKSGKITHLKAVISFDEVTEEKRRAGQDADVKIFHFNEVIDIGKQQGGALELDAPTPETVYMFCYTSGTTGDPKGVMLSHKQFVSCIHLADWF